MMPVHPRITRERKTIEAMNKIYCNNHHKSDEELCQDCNELLEYAIEKNVDAFITADLKYHDFQDAEGKIFVIDAGHYETEVPVLDEIQKRLKRFLQVSKQTKVFKFRGSTNPIIFYNKLGAN